MRVTYEVIELESDLGMNTFTRPQGYDLNWPKPTTHGEGLGTARGDKWALHMSLFMGSWPVTAGKLAARSKGQLPP